MIISRKALLSKLRTIKPALARSDYIPVSTCFCFDGKHIVATNDEIAIAVPQRSDFRGAVEKSLLELLSISRAAAVEINATNGKAQITLDTLDGRVATMPLFPPEDFRFQIPTERPAHSVPAAFLHGIEHCLKCDSHWHLGVTLIPAQDGLWLCAGTNEAALTSLTRLRPSPFTLKERVTLPADFCKQMLRLAGTAKTWRFDIYPDYALFTGDDVLLFSDVIRTNNYPLMRLDFVGVVERHVPKDYASTAIALPKGLPEVFQLCRITALGRVFPTINVSHDEVSTTIDVKDGVATFAAQSYCGIGITAHLRMPWHPDVQTKFKVSSLCEACRWAERILFTDHAIIMNSGPHFYLCTTFPSNRGDEEARRRGHDARTANIV